MHFSEYYTLSDLESMEREGLIRLVKVDSQIPFIPSDEQLIYVEDEYNERLNQWLNKHIDKVRETYKKMGYEFCYLPDLYAKLSSNDYREYYSPSENPIDSDSLPNWIRSDFLKEYLIGGNDNPLTSGLLLYYSCGYTYGFYRFVFFQFQTDNNEVFNTCWRKILKILLKAKQESDGIMYSSYSTILPYEEPYDADGNFDEDVMNLMYEVEQKIEKLREYGVGEMIIKRLFLKKFVISKMFITKDARIIMTDYENREIKMPLLDKAVYFLFLRHAEGICFKDLPKYREELMSIYCNLNPNRPLPDLRKSVMDVTDNTKNSINEKCARIREAFVSEFDERLARCYYIYGQRGYPKKIPLNRSMVTWEWEV